MNCCDYDCTGGANCPARVNPTTRTFPRTLLEAFPRNPCPNFDEVGVDYHEVLEVALIALLVALPVILWLQ